MSKRNKDEIIGYSEFIKICNVVDPRNWHGMAVRPDGIWVQPPLDNEFLFPAERAVLSEHPKKDLMTPALKFPCTYEQLRNFLEYVEVGLAESYLGAKIVKVASDNRKGGRPKGPLYEAFEYAYLKFLEEGNTEILRQGKINEFLDRLKELSDDENKNISDYIAERIEIEKKRNGLFTITKKERVLNESKTTVITEKKINYSKKDVSKIMTILRK